MRCWPGETSDGRRALFAAALTVALSAGTPAQAQPGNEHFLVDRVDTRLVDGVYLLDAGIDYQFSNESLDALDNGVALTVAMDIEVVRVHQRWFDTRVASLQASYRIEVHPLSGRYLLVNPGSGETRNFATLDELRAALGEVRDFPVIDRAALDPDGRYRLRIRPRVDIEALPSPLRALAYLKALWRGGGRWSEWPLVR